MSEITHTGNGGLTLIGPSVPWEVVIRAVPGRMSLSCGVWACDFLKYGRRVSKDHPGLPKVLDRASYSCLLAR